jgi:hypothetical protein
MTCRSTSEGVLLNQFVSFPTFTYIIPSKNIGALASFGSFLLDAGRLIIDGITWITFVRVPLLW